MGGWGERERVAGQETSSADEVIGLKIKRWRHLKPIPVNELSGAPGKGGDRRGQGGGRRAGPRARPPIPRPPGSAARLRASLRPLGEGSGHVPFRSSATRRQVPQAPLGGAGAARGGGPAASSFRARARASPDPGPPAAPQQVFKGAPPPPDQDPEPFPPGRAVSSCLTSVRKRKDLRELQSLLQKSDESQMQGTAILVKSMLQVL